MRKGDLVTVQANHWNCSITVKLIGKKGTFVSINKFDFCVVSFNGHRETLHKDELKVAS